MINYLVPALNSKLEKKYHFNSDKLLQYFKTHEGKESYYCLYNLEPRDSFASYSGNQQCALDSVVFDLDCDKLETAQLDTIKLYDYLKLDDKTARIFFSGSKGFHIYVSAEYLGLDHNSKTLAKDCGRLAEKLKKIVPTLDLSVYKPAQKFRSPNSRHPKTGLYKVQIEREDLDLTIKTIKEKAEHPKPYEFNYTVSTKFGGFVENSGGNSAADYVTQVSTNYGLPDQIDNPFLKYAHKKCIKRFETERLDTGNRHTASRILISEYHGQGLDKDECTKKMEQYALLQGVQDRWESDILRMIDDAYDNGKVYGSGCYDYLKKEYCSKDCGIYNMLVKTKRAQFEPTVTNTVTELTKTEHIVTTESIDKDFAENIASGFHKETLVGKELKKSPDFMALREFFNEKYPYVSLKETNLTYIFNGSHYIEASDTQIKMFAHKYFNPEPSIKTTSEFLARVRYNNPVSSDWFKQSTEGLINLANGVYSIKDDSFDPIKTKARGFRYTLPYNYDKSALCPMFDRMLDKVTCGDKQLAQNLLEFFGYALSNSPCYSDKVLVLYGEGSNGKSRFVEIMRSLMGHAQTSFNQRDMSTDSKLRMLENSLLTIIEEMPSFTTKDFWEEMKGLASGKTLTVDIKFKDAHSFQNRSKFVFTCNKLPMGTDPTHGYYRRLLIIPFNATFKPTDHDFIANIDTQIIESEMPGVFNRVISAYKALKERNFRFVDAEASNKQLESYMAESNSVAQWFGDLDWEFEQHPTKDDQITLNACYEHYKTWCEGSGLRQVNKAEFSKRLAKLDFRFVNFKFRSRVKGVLHTVFCGIRCEAIPKDSGVVYSGDFEKEKF